MASRRVPGELSPPPMDPRRLPGELSPRTGYPDAVAGGPDEAAAPQWWETEQAHELVGDARGFPGFISRDGNEHFERLYADSAARLQKLSRMQEEAALEKEQRERHSMRPTKRASAKDLSHACDRLYGEAAKRQERMARKKEEQQYLEDLHEALRVGSRCRSTPNLAREGDRRWDRLYAGAAEKEEKLERQRLRKAEVERKQLESNSVHSKAEAPQRMEAFNRLYNDGVQREWRRERQKTIDHEMEQMELDKVSVHRSNGGTAADEAAERLYLEGKMRTQRQENQRRLKEQTEVTSLQRKAPPEHIAKRVNLLYEDAERRKNDREWMQEEHEKETLADLLKQSVHASVRDNAASETDRIFERAQKPESREMPVSKAPRSARITQRQRPDTGLHVRSVTARRSLPGDLDVADRNTPRTTPRSQSAPGKSPRNAGVNPGLVGGARSGSAKRISALDGPAPFEKVPPPAEGPKSRPKSQAGRQAQRKGSGPYIMTHLVEEGARQALSAELPRA